MQQNMTACRVFAVWL